VESVDENVNLEAGSAFFVCQTELD